MGFSLWHISKIDATAAPIAEEDGKQLSFDELEIARQFIDLLPPLQQDGVIVIVNDYNEQIIEATDWKLLAQISGTLEPNPKEQFRNYRYQFIHKHSAELIEREYVWTHDLEAINKSTALCPADYEVVQIINLDTGHLIWQDARTQKTRHD